MGIFSVFVKFGNEFKIKRNFRLILAVSAFKMPTAVEYNSKFYEPIIEDSHLLGSYMALFSTIDTPNILPFFPQGGGGNGSQEGVFLGVFFGCFFHHFPKLAFLQLVFFLQIFKIGVFFLVFFF